MPIRFENPAGVAICALSLYPLLAAIFDWDWFMNNRKAQFFVGIFGRDGARVFYALLGGAFFIFGILVTTGEIPLEIK